MNILGGAVENLLQVIEMTAIKENQKQGEGQEEDSLIVKYVNFRAIIKQAAL